ncbi:GMC family oxidoreductase N-terminal domain-containing protein [Streptomyces sp. MI02-7b]|nr:GMC family oxidoreductase N-terminal domain-containing protein [Streptomyces sp. MI02-7b]MDX3077170.1 GMC family oxidoreductase N-terminal domain-containing protein [Streptomyces sp. MI02-7b]
MVFARGHRSSYGAWPVLGAEGWGFDDLLPYFMRSENTAGRYPALRGVGGPLTVGPRPVPRRPVGPALGDPADAGGQARVGGAGAPALPDPGPARRYALSPCRGANGGGSPPVPRRARWSHGARCPHGFGGKPKRTS